MATIDNAVRFLEQNDTPYWTIHSGSSKVGQSNGTDNLQDSISRFRECMDLQSPGNYKLVCAKNPNDNRGGLTFNFTKGQSSQSQSNSMQSASLTNAYGVPDLVYKQIVEEARRTLLFEQMADKFGPMVDLVKDMEKRLNKLEKDFYDDEDGDGTPDFLQMAKTASDTMKGVSEVKKVFDGGAGFRL